MKRVILTIGLSVCGWSLVNAQDMHVGPEGGINFSSMSVTHNGEKQKSDIVPGLKLGFIVDIGFTQMVSLQPGLFYNMKGYSTETNNIINAGNVQYQQTFKTRYFTNNLELPVNLQFKFRAGKGYFFAGGGPYAAITLGGQKETRDIRSIASGGESGETKIATDRALRLGNTPTDDLRPFDVGMNLNAGYLILRGIYLRGNLGFGFANLKPQGTSDNALRNFSTGITIGYMFGNKRD